MDVDVRQMSWAYDQVAEMLLILMDRLGYASIAEALAYFISLNA